MDEVIGMIALLIVWNIVLTIMIYLNKYYTDKIIDVLQSHNKFIKRLMDKP